MLRLQKDSEFVIEPDFVELSDITFDISESLKDVDKRHLNATANFVVVSKEIANEINRLTWNLYYDNLISSK
ncbi:MAG: hypothetical protein IJH39_04610 [Clostridia bacterium]|nr:hypothetical protein [Clostridia bacterium]